MGGGGAQRRQTPGEEVHRHGREGGRAADPGVARRRGDEHTAATPNGQEQPTGGGHGRGGSGERGGPDGGAARGGSGHDGEGTAGEQEGERCVNGNRGAPTNANQTLTVLYTNSQSLPGKVNELSCIASDLKPDIIALTETWCNGKISSAVLSIDGYELVPELRMDRTNTGGGRGGGLIIYARSGIPILKIDRTILNSQLCSFTINDVTLNLVYRLSLIHI